MHLGIDVAKNPLGRGGVSHRGRLDAQILDRFVSGVQSAKQLRSSPAVERLQGLSRRQLVELRVADQNRRHHDSRPTPAALGAVGVGTGRGALDRHHIIFIILLISSSEVPMP